MGLIVVGLSGEEVLVIVVGVENEREEGRGREVTSMIEMGGRGLVEGRNGVSSFFAPSEGGLWFGEKMISSVWLDDEWVVLDY